jgi:phosphate:Na+ symporter
MLTWGVPVRFSTVALLVAAALFLTGSIVFGGSYTVETQGCSQHGGIGDILDCPLSVTVLDSLGAPVMGVPVDFLVESSEGSLVPPFTGYEPVIQEGDTVAGTIEGMRISTGADGTASVSLKLGESTCNSQIAAVVFLPDGTEFSVGYSALAVDLQQILFQVIGGLALFLLGMKMMSESLQIVAGDKMRTVLRRITSNRVLGLIAGVLVTGVIQSSSATTVITVSFVNAGLLALKQAIGVVIGANIGTTVTGQLIAFKVIDYAFPIIAVGFAMRAFSSRKRTQFWGRAITGLGLLFLGMTLMSDILKPLNQSTAVHEFFTRFSDNPILAVMAGILVTSIIQSSSATVGLTMTLAGAGLISLQGAVYLVLGDNIGTTITAQLSAIGASRAARQTAMAHTLFNVIGVIYMGFLITNPDGLFLSFVRSTSTDPLRQVANAHSIFNIFNALVFLPLVPALAWFCRVLIPDRDQVAPQEAVLNLDENLLDTPALAMDNLEREVVKMAVYAGDAVEKAITHFMTGEHDLDDILAMEDQVDCMQRDLTVYAAKLFERELDKENALKLPVIIHTINDLERVSDHAVNMVEARSRVSGSLVGRKGFMPEAAQDAASMLRKMIKAAETALATHQRISSEAVLSLEEKLNMLEDRAKRLYTESLSQCGQADMAGLAMLDFISYCERSGDHLTNIAQSLLGGGIWHGNDDAI